VIPRLPGTARTATPTKRTAPRLLATALVSAGLLLAPAVAPAVQAAPATGWLSSWGAAPSHLSNLGDCNPCSVRNTVHVSLGGSTARLTLSNVLGTADLVVARTNLSLPDSYNSAASVPGTRVPVTFAGSPTITIPAGGEVVSDPITFDVRAGTDVQVSSYFSGNAQLTYHSFGTRSGSYVWRGSDQSESDNPIAATGSYKSVYVASSLDVQPTAGSTAPAGTVVVFGDSITDGEGSTPNADERWADRLADRLSSLPAAYRLGVVNEAISGNRILQDGTGPAALSRFDRDVLGRPGVRSVIILEGINDLRQFAEPMDGKAQSLIDGLTTLANKARAAGISPVAATILPFKGRGEYTEAREGVRQAVNAWIRTTDVFDSYVDFDAVIDDPANPGAMRPDYDSGDHLHPGPNGHRAMGDAVDLAALGASGETYAGTAYTRPATVDLRAPQSVVRGQTTHVVAKVTAAQDTQSASVRFDLPTGWTAAYDQGTTVRLGALRAGESAVASLEVAARTPGLRNDVDVVATASLDGLATSVSQQIRTTQRDGAPDTLAPLTSLTVTPAAPTSTGWYTGPVTVDVNVPSSEPGFVYAEHRVDGGAWQAHLDPFVLAEGRHTVEGRITDAAGNTSTVVTRLVDVDTTAPQVAATVTTTTRALTVTASDATSGIAAISYRIGDGAWIAYSGPVALGRSAATVSFRATDKAGNLSAARSLTVAAAPATPVTPPPTAHKASARVKVTAKATTTAKRGKIKLRVISTGDVRGTAKITVKHGKQRVVKTVKVSAKGKATLRLPKLKKAGKYKVKARFTGSASVAAATGKTKLTVRR